ncbi:MAG: hypothetical protein IJU57_00695 [Clostridia bacterium]|nr:hypothetical protein [Clostridia bacterium]
MKRLVATFMIMLLLAGALSGMASCGEPGHFDTENPDTVSVSDELDSLNYKGETFTVHTSVNVFTASFHSSNYLIQGADEVAADKAAASALTRNKKAEEDLNVRLSFLESDYDFSEAVSNVRNLIKSGADSIDVIINDIGVINLCTEGLLMDANYGKYFDFTRKYWYDDMMSSASLNTETRYMLAGDYFIDIIRDTHCLLMNKDYYAEIGCDPESVYQTVRDGEWTLDAMYTIIKGGEDGAHPTYQDFQGNRKRDRRDKWGLVLWQWWGPMIPFLSTADPGYINRNEEGYPEITVNNERSVMMCEKLMALFNADETAVGVHNNMQDTIDCFVEGKILFLTCQRLGSLESEIYANADLNFAVLPYPKLDEYQRNYISSVNDTTEMGFIPGTVSFSRLDFISAVLEKLSRETEEIVIPKYYESTLKIRYARESANAEMIQLIHDTHGNTFPLIWGLGDGSNIFTIGFYNSISKNQSVFASFYRANENSARTMLESYIAKDREFREEIRSRYSDYMKK